uniref:Uncharacterized protein n=2 Tax=Aureoumbra lagunensis TaxID=44058 RepID=A0A7S3NHR1_9STRA|mmetsp:Transcript_3496/g.4906  ORF Transcript_3496/g.4906 Transcript_3496/m.4906 type:complete len:191 (+) Transcript_3496:618-1190(+)
MIFPVYYGPQLTTSTKHLQRLMNSTGLSIRTHLGNTPLSLAKYVHDFDSLLKALGLAHADADLHHLASRTAQSQIQALLTDVNQLFTTNPTLLTVLDLMNTAALQNSPQAITRITATARALLHHTASLQQDNLYPFSHQQNQKQFYMPLEHRFAMYAPLFMPLFLPVVLGQIRASRAFFFQWRSRTTTDK